MHEPIHFVCTVNVILLTVRLTRIGFLRLDPDNMDLIFLWSQPRSQTFVRSLAIKRLQLQTNPWEAPPRSWQICHHFEFINKLTLVSEKALKFKDFSFQHGMSIFTCFGTLILCFSIDFVCWLATIQKQRKTKVLKGYNFQTKGDRHNVLIKKKTLILSRSFRFHQQFGIFFKILMVTSQWTVL